MVDPIAKIVPKNMGNSEGLSITPRKMQAPSLNRDIKEGEELLFDYGERRPHELKVHRCMREQFIHPSLVIFLRIFVLIFWNFLEPPSAFLICQKRLNCHLPLSFICDAYKFFKVGTHNNTPSHPHEMPAIRMTSLLLEGLVDFSRPCTFNS